MISTLWELTPLWLTPAGCLVPYWRLLECRAWKVRAYGTAPWAWWDLRSM